MWGLESLKGPRGWYSYTSLALLLYLVSVKTLKLAKKVATARE